MSCQSDYPSRDAFSNTFRMNQIIQHLCKRRNKREGNLIKNNVGFFGKTRRQRRRRVPRSTSADTSTTVFLMST